MNWHGWLAKSGLKPAFSYAFYVISYLVMMWLTYAHFADLIFQKCSRSPQFFLRFLCGNRALAAVSCTFCRPPLPKVLRALTSFLTFSIFKWKVLSLAVLVHFFRPHLPKVPSSPYSLVNIFYDEIELSQKSPEAPFADLIFQTVAPTTLSSFTIFYTKSSLSLQSCALFVDHFPRSSRETAETETLLRRPRQPPYPKKCRVSRPRVFSSLNSRVPDLSHFPTTCMMMWWLPWWLRWWCGCHHGEKASHDNRS